MDEKNQLLLGIDLGKQASQITCFDRTEYEAEKLMVRWYMSFRWR